MKTITGKVFCSTPVSLSRAAQTISNFAATENGASQAISAYIRRTSASFNELNKVHREIEKPSKSEGKHKRSKSGSAGIRAAETVEDGENRIRNEFTKEQGEKRKHKKEKENSDGKIGNLEEQRTQSNGEIGEEGKKAERKKKRKNEKFLDAKENNSSEQQNKKKKKKKKGVLAEVSKSLRISWSNKYAFCLFAASVVLVYGFLLSE